MKEFNKNHLNNINKSEKSINIIDGTDLVLSFNFSVFNLEIEHKILKEIGEFTIFCMKAIHNNVNIKGISSIIQIKESIIEKQLSFAISRKYLTSDFVLTKKGIETIELFEFINIFNQKKVEIALEHYIENDSKLLYSVDNKKLEDESIGYLVKDNLYDYKVQNYFDEIIEKDINKIKDFIIVEFDNYKIIIEKYLKDFIFKIKKNEKQKFYNYKIDENNFIDKLNNVQSRTKNCISIEIPILEVDKTITSEILDREFIDKIKDEFDKYKYFNLIDGKPIKLRIQKNVNNSNIKIKPLLNKIDIIKLNLDNKEILINDLLYIDIKTEIKEFYSIKFFDLTEIMSNI